MQLLIQRPFLTGHRYNKQHSLITSTYLLNTYSGPGAITARGYIYRNKIYLCPARAHSLEGREKNQQYRGKQESLRSSLLTKDTAAWPHFSIIHCFNKYLLNFLVTNRVVNNLLSFFHSILF